MLIESIAKRYARPLFDLAIDRGIVDIVRKDLYQTVSLIKKEEELKTIFYSPQLLPKIKKSIIEKVLPGLTSLTRDFIFLLFDKRRENILENVLSHYDYIMEQYYNFITVDVVTVTDIPEDIKNKLKLRLMELVGKDIQLRISKDKKILGGILLRTRDTVIDGTLKTKLAQLQKKLLQAI